LQFLSVAQTQENKLAAPSPPTDPVSIRQFEHCLSKAMLHSDQVPPYTRLLTQSHLKAVSPSSKPWLCLQGWWDDAYSPWPLTWLPSLCVTAAAFSFLAKKKGLQTVYFYSVRRLWAQAWRAAEPHGEAWLTPALSKYIPGDAKPTSFTAAFTAGFLLMVLFSSTLTDRVR